MHTYVKYDENFDFPFALSYKKSFVIDLETPSPCQTWGVSWTKKVEFSLEELINSDVIKECGRGLGFIHRHAQFIKIIVLYIDEVGHIGRSVELELNVSLV